MRVIILLLGVLLAVAVSRQGGTASQSSKFKSKQNVGATDKRVAQPNVQLEGVEKRRQRLLQARSAKVGTPNVQIEGVKKRRERLFRNRASNVGSKQQKPKIEGIKKRRDRLLQNRSAKSVKKVNIEGVAKRRERLLAQRNGNVPKAKNTKRLSKKKTKKPKIEGVAKRRERLLQNRTPSNKSKKQTKVNKLKLHMDGSGGGPLQKALPELVESIPQAPAQESIVVQPVVVDNPSSNEASAVQVIVQTEAPVVVVQPEAQQTEAIVVSVVEKPPTQIPINEPVPENPVVVAVVQEKPLVNASPASENSVVAVVEGPKEPIIVVTVAETPAVTFEGVEQRKSRLRPTQSPRRDIAQQILEFKAQQAGEPVAPRLLANAVVASPVAEGAVSVGVPSSRSENVVVASIIETPALIFEGVEQRAKRLIEAREAETVPVQLEGVEQRAQRLTVARNEVEQGQNVVTSVADSPLSNVIVAAKIEETGPVIVANAVETETVVVAKAEEPNSIVADEASRHDKSPRRDVIQAVVVDENPTAATFVETTASKDTPILSNVIVAPEGANAVVGAEKASPALSVSTAAPDAIIGVQSVSDDVFNGKETTAARLESPEFSLGESSGRLPKSTEVISDVVTHQESPEYKLEQIPTVPQPLAPIEIPPEKTKQQQIVEVVTVKVEPTNEQVKVVETESREYKESRTESVVPELPTVVNTSVEEIVTIERPNKEEPKVEVKIEVSPTDAEVQQPSSESDSQSTHLESKEYPLPPKQSVSVVSGSQASSGDFKSLIESLTKPSLKDRIERVGGKLKRIIEDVQVIIVKDPPLPVLDEEAVTRTPTESPSDKQLREYLQQQLLAQ